MSLENEHDDASCPTSTLDPRIRILREHYFSVRPAPLEEWLWQQTLPSSAERVFWLHWQEGHRRGDFCSEIPLRTVARRCHLNISSVTRAYQRLEKLGCLRRSDPGRNAANPFCQATALTEVFIPKALLGALPQYARRNRRLEPTRSAASTTPHNLSAAPSNPASPTESGSKSAEGTEPPDTSHPESPKTSDSSTPKDPLAGLSGRQRLAAMSGWRDAMSATERRNFDDAFREQRAMMCFDTSCRLSADVQAQVQQLLGYLARRPSSDPKATLVARRPKTTSPRPPAMGLSRTAALRGKLIALRGVAATDELLRQITWSIEQGALTKFPVPKAIAIALRKVREDAWTRPHRMPPNWWPKARNTSCAAVHN